MTVLYMFLFGLVKGSSVSDVAVLHRLFLFGLGHIKKDDAFPLSLQFLFLNRDPLTFSDDNLRGSRSSRSSPCASAFFAA